MLREEAMKNRGWERGWETWRELLGVGKLGERHGINLVANNYRLQVNSTHKRIRITAFSIENVSVQR